MPQTIDHFFLAGFRNATYFEKKKATYLFYIILTALGFIVAITLSQLVIGMDGIYLTANLIALTGICVALTFFSQKKTDAAGHITAVSILIAIAMETIVRDRLSDDPNVRYRLYIHLSALLGVYFIILSFFRDRKYVLWYGIVFEAMLFAHAAVIYNQVRHLPEMAMYVIEHWVTVSVSVAIVAAFCTWLLSYMEALLQQNMEYAERFKSQNEQLEKMVDERTSDLRNSNRSLREFAYVVSHDLKEPLRTISGFVTLIKKELQKRGLNEKEIEEYINYVTAGTRQMERLISDILVYSNLNEVQKKFEEVDMSELVRMVRSRLAKPIYESDGSILLTKTLPVKGDMVMLFELFENLVSNAIKYRSPDRELKITIGSTMEGDVVRYFVQDNGIGISEKYFNTIFEAFRRLHSKSEYEGTGVGLAICKRIVDIHDGDMGVDSVDGEGSLFWFTLPAAVQTGVPEIQPVVHAA